MEYILITLVKNDLGRLSNIIMDQPFFIISKRYNVMYFLHAKIEYMHFLQVKIENTASAKGLSP